MAASDPVGVEQPAPAWPLRGSRPAVRCAIAIGLFLATLVWQPWGRAAPPVVPATPVSTPIAAIVADAGPTASNPGPTPSPGPTASQGSSVSPSPFSSRGPRPSFGASASGTPGPATYRLARRQRLERRRPPRARPLAAADERCVPDATGALQAPGGSLLVLQHQAGLRQQADRQSGRPGRGVPDPGRLPRLRRGPPARRPGRLPRRDVPGDGPTGPGDRRRPRPPRARAQAALDRPRAPERHGRGPALHRPDLGLGRSRPVRAHAAGDHAGRRVPLRHRGARRPRPSYLYACIEP